MSTPTVKVTTMQIAGTLVAVSLGVISSLLGTTLMDSVVLGLLVEILAFLIDMHLRSLQDGKRLADVIREYPVLQNYGYCISEYAVVRRTFTDGVPDPLGSVTRSWIDEKIRLHQSDFRNNWKGGRIIFPAEEVEQRSLEVHKSLRVGGFATQLEKYSEFWEAADSYLKLNRALVSKQSKEITRVFLLQSQDSLKNQALVTQIKLDRAAGINTMIAFTAGPDCVEDQEAIKDFGLWDDELLCIVELSPQTWRVTGSTYSVMETDLAKARRWMNHILMHAKSSDVYFK